MKITLMYTVVVLFSACQAIRNNKDQNNQGTGLNREAFEIARESIARGVLPEPLVSVQSIPASTSQNWKVSDIGSWVKSQDSFVYKKSDDSISSPTKDISDTSLGRVMICVLKNTHSFLHANGELVTISSEYESSPCQAYYNDWIADLKSEKAGSPSDSTSRFAVGLLATRKALLSFRCPGQNLSFLNGQTVDAGYPEITKSPQAKAISKACMIGGNTMLPHQWRQSIKATYTYHTRNTDKSGAHTFSSQDMATASGVMSPDGGLCQRSIQSSAVTLSNCVSFESQLASNIAGVARSMSEPYFYKISTTQMSRTTGPFYDSGTAQFEVENWKGTVSFKGTNNEPYWEAQSSTGEKTSGTISAHTSDGDFQLVSPLQKRIAPSFTSPPSL